VIDAGRRAGALKTDWTEPPEDAWPMGIESVASPPKYKEQVPQAVMACNWLRLMSVSRPVARLLSGRIDLKRRDLVPQATGVPCNAGGSNPLAKSIWQV